MITEAKTSFLLWTVQVQRYLRSEVINLEPHEYSIGAVFIIAIGFVMLSGRR